MPFNYEYTDLPEELRDLITPAEKEPIQVTQDVRTDPELDRLLVKSKPEVPDFDLTGLEKYIVRDTEELTQDQEIHKDNIVSTQKRNNLEGLWANVLQGTAEAGAAFFGGLQTAAEAIGKPLGLKPSGTFKDLQTMYEENAELLDQVGYQGEGFWADVTKTTARGIGRVPLDFAQILSLGKFGLPIHSAITSGLDAVGEGKDIDEVLGATGGGALKGALLHGFLKATSLFPKRISVPISGAGFGAISAAAGAEGPEIVSSAIIGGGLQAVGPSPNYKAWVAGIKLAKPAVKGLDFQANKYAFYNRFKDSSTNFDQLKLDILQTANKYLPAEIMGDFTVTVNANKGTQSMLSIMGKGPETLIREAKTPRQLEKAFEKVTKKVESRLETERVEALKAKGFGRVLESMADTYMISMTPLRVADALGGYQNYGSLDARLVKRFFHAETRAYSVGKWLGTKYWEEIRDLGVKRIDPEMEFRLTCHGLKQMGATNALHELLRSRGLSVPPPLQGTEAQILKITNKYMDAHVRELAKEWEIETGKPFTKVFGYVFPLKYVGEPMLSTRKLLARNMKRRPGTRGGKERFKPRVQPTKTPRSDFFTLVMEGINEQQWFLNIHPQIRRTEKLIGHKLYQRTATPRHNRFWAEYISAFKTKGQNAPFFRETWMLGAARRNLTTAILGYKLTSALAQPFAVMDAMSYAVPLYGRKVAQDILKEVSRSLFVDAKYAKKAMKRSHALRVRSGGEAAIRDIEVYDPQAHFKGMIAETKRAFKSPAEPGVFKGWAKNAWKTYKNESLALLRELDVRTAAGTQKAIEKILRKNNIPNWRREAEVVMSIMNGSAEISMRPLVLHRGEMPKMFFTFQSFFLNRWGIIAHDLIDKGILKAVKSKAEMAREATRAFKDPELFTQALQTKEWALLTPENPNYQKLGRLKNKARRIEFEKDIRELGYEPIKAKGIYKPDGYRENSYLIPGMSTEEAIVLGKKWGQAEVATDKGLVTASTGMRKRFNLDQINTKPGKDLFITSLNIGGRKIRFNIPYNETMTRLTREEIRPKYTQGSWKSRFNALIGLMILGAGNVAENEVRKALYQFTTGADVPTQDLLTQFMMTVPEHVPVFGNMLQAVSRGRGFEPPLIRALDNLFAGTYRVIAGKKGTTKVRGAMKALESAITATTGIPGTAQFFDLAELLLKEPGAQHHINLTKRQKMIRRIRRS